MAEHDHSHDWRPVPILPSRDAAVTAAFWQRLGFRVVDATPDDDPYLIAVREGAELHFVHQPDLDPATNRSLGAPTLMPWGLREAWLTDPDGTVVRIGSSA